MAAADIDFPFVHASADSTPVDDASHDIVDVPPSVASLTASEWVNAMS